MVILWLICIYTAEVFSQGVYEDVEEKQIASVNENATLLYPLNVTKMNADLLKASEIENGHTEANNKPERSKYKNEATIWKIEATYAPPKEEDNVGKDSNEKNNFETTEKSTEFRPSPQLENYFELDGPEMTDYYYKFTSTPKTLPSKFRGTKEFKPSQIDPLGLFHDEEHFSKSNWKTKQQVDVESKPTVGSPITVPAGGLYKHPIIKGQYTSNNGHDFSLEHHEHLPHQKRRNPWRGLVKLVSAAIPLGLIISALTPSVITLQNADTGPKHGVKSAGSRIPEDVCKRRLLCELRKSIQQKRKQQGQLSYDENCTKHQCENPSTLKGLMDIVNSENQPITHNTSGDVITLFN